MNKKLRPLLIGDLKINVPIIQGGMGVKVSTAALAIAVANCGGAGTIASAGFAYGSGEVARTYVEFSHDILHEEIRLAKKETKGVVGANIMVALSNYEQTVRSAVKENVDFIASGAGLPLSLPEFTEGSAVKLIPIVSSARTAGIICKTWKRRYGRLPDAIIVEGPMAGGHLGFKSEALKNHTADSLEKLVTDVIKLVAEYRNIQGPEIPVIAAGGIFDGKDMAKFLRLGAKGVQLGTRFVATDECAVSDKFKELYVAAGEDDVIIINSPVGMPGRAIKTEFINRIRRGEKIPFNCTYLCLRSCDVKEAPYCIARALANAAAGDIDNAIIFAGSNVTRIKEIVPVKTLIDSIAGEAARSLNFT